MTKQVSSSLVSSYKVLLITVESIFILETLIVNDMTTTILIILIV